MRIKIIRLLIVLGGILAGQFILFGPSLTGQKILLPLDILARPGVYLPTEPKFPHDYVLADLVTEWEPVRLFAISEFKAGRLPMWDPYQYAGCPLVCARFSPFFLLGCCSSSPRILAWTQLLTAIVAGLGAYLFFRCSLRVSFWAAAIAAWCYPLTGFFTFWQGAPAGFPVLWLPWVLLAVDRTICRAKFAPVGLSIVSGLTLVSGQIDTAGQTLLVSGLYAGWRLWDRYRGNWFGKQVRRTIGVLVVGWLLGFLLASPYLLPLLEYARTGARLNQRAAGREERPPVGLSALPQVVLPDVYGTTHNDSLLIAPPVQPESAGGAYAGLFATFLAAPMAWCSRRHRSAIYFWCFLGFFGLTWTLNIPGFVALLRLPGLKMLSWNRLVFATAFAILALAAIGLDALGRRFVHRRKYFLLPAGLLAVTMFWCFYHTLFLPEPIATSLAAMVSQHQSFRWIHDVDGVQRVQAWFSTYYAVSAALCGIGIMGWWLVWLRPLRAKWAVAALGTLMLADMLWFAHDRSAQCDPTLYYPPIPALEDVAKAAPGRIIGIGCLPAGLSQVVGLKDIRGYDAVDPERLVTLLRRTGKDPYDTPFSPAAVQTLVPRFSFEPPNKIEISPILDMLNVRYVIGRGSPSPEMRPTFQSADYVVFENQRALPRVFVPKHIETVPNAETRVEKLGSPEFNPREIAYVESPVDLPASCAGRAEIVDEIPNRVSVTVQMETPGLVVLADSWDKGWTARLNGSPAPILRVNHAVRGVVAPAGASRVEFSYDPASFRLGLHLSELAAAIIGVWTLALLFTRSRRPCDGANTSPLNPASNSSQSPRSMGLC